MPSNLGPDFYKKLLMVSSEVGMKPEDLLNVMASESGLNPAAHNSNGNASGLLQFMPSTLKAMGYKGNHSDFRQLAAEKQLDYVEKIIKTMMQINGGPFTSAAQYYVGNFLPAALKLPGIKSGDPNTVIVAKNPTKPHLPGYTIDTEKSWYNANPGLDVDKDGFITYKDIQAILNRVASGSNYKSALLSLENDTGYKPSEHKSSQNKSLDSLLDSFLQEVVAQEKKNIKLYKQFLPSNHILISVGAKDYTTAIEFSKILCAVLDEKLLCKAYIHSDNNNVEIECSIHGPKEDCLNIIKDLSNNVIESFKLATSLIKIGDIKTDFINKKSSYQVISADTVILHHRKFLLKFV